VRRVPTCAGRKIPSRCLHVGEALAEKLKEWEQLGRILRPTVIIEEQAAGDGEPVFFLGGGYSHSRTEAVFAWTSGSLGRHPLAAADIHPPFRSIRRIFHRHRRCDSPSRRFRIPSPEKLCAYTSEQERRGRRTRDTIKKSHHRRRGLLRRRFPGRKRVTLYERRRRGSSGIRKHEHQPFAISVRGLLETSGALFEVGLSSDGPNEVGAPWIPKSPRRDRARKQENGDESVGRR
jgi:hypothetical protein